MVNTVGFNSLGGDTLTIRVNIEDMSNRDQIQMLYRLLYRFAPRPDQEGYKPFQDASDTILKSVHRFWEERND